MSQRTTCPFVHALAPLLTLVGTLTLCACALDSAPNTAFTVVPGQGKDLAAFQQDDAICHQHAVAHTGYGGPRQPSVTKSAAPEAGAPEAAAPGSATPPPEDVDVDDTAYLQCMAARGDTVRPEPIAVASPASAFAYPYTFFGAGLAFGGWHHGGWHHGGGYYHGGYHGGSPHGWGGGHGGGGHAGGGRR